MMACPSADATALTTEFMPALKAGPPSPARTRSIMFQTCCS
jgi:hypothetical protein